MAYHEESPERTNLSHEAQVYMHQEGMQTAWLTGNYYAWEDHALQMSALLAENSYTPSDGMPLSDAMEQQYSQIRQLWGLQNPAQLILDDFNRVRAQTLDQ